MSAFSPSGTKFPPSLDSESETLQSEKPIPIASPKLKSLGISSPILLISLQKAIDTGVYILEVRDTLEYRFRFGDCGY